MIRLGDGEAVLLSFGEDLWLQDLAYLHGHWGAERVVLRDVGESNATLETAIRGADVVGFETTLSTRPSHLTFFSDPPLKSETR